jgi:hypothetical protein
MLPVLSVVCANIKEQQNSSIQTSAIRQNRVPRGGGVWFNIIHHPFGMFELLAIQEITLLNKFCGRSQYGVTIVAGFVFETNL